MNINISKVKIFVAIPIESVENVRKEIFKTKAEVIGNYTCCTSSVKCVGTFKPNENSNPYIGKKNKIEYVDEEKLEFVCNVEDVKEVVKTIRQVHPYEEPAIDIVPLIDENSF